MTRSEISVILVEAGASLGALSMWWRGPHPALNHYSPRRALDLFGHDDDITSLVAETARSDARDLQRLAAEPPRRASAAAHIESTHLGGRSRCPSRS